MEVMERAGVASDVLFFLVLLSGFGGGFIYHAQGFNRIAEAFWGARKQKRDHAGFMYKSHNGGVYLVDS